MSKIIYAELRERVSALFIDSIVTVSLLYGVTMIISNFEPVENWIRIVAFIGVFFIYDPLFISLFGGTIGQFLTGLRVKRSNNPSKNIFFPLAILRYFVKLLLGWISILTVTSNSESKAIHDMLVNSIVVKKTK